MNMSWWPVGQKCALSQAVSRTGALSYLCNIHFFKLSEEQTGCNILQDDVKQINKKSGTRSVKHGIK